MTQRIEIIDPIISLGFLRLPIYRMQIVVPNAPQTAVRHYTATARVLRAADSTTSGTYIVKTMNYPIEVTTLSVLSKFAPDDEEDKKSFDV